jgi:hypothetical protein
MADAAPRTWILTSSPDNHVATAQRDLTVVGHAAAGVPT